MSERRPVDSVVRIDDSRRRAAQWQSDDSTRYREIASDRPAPNPDGPGSRIRGAMHGFAGRLATLVLADDHSPRPFFQRIRQ